jgi:hypothetical protein
MDQILRNNKITYKVIPPNSTVRIFTGIIIVMKKFSYAAVLIIMLSSCVTVKVPPGQAKKVVNPPPGQVKKSTGSKSAAPFAPGQQKTKSAGKKQN